MPSKPPFISVTVAPSLPVPVPVPLSVPHATTATAIVIKPPRAPKPVTMPGPVSVSMPMPMPRPLSRLLLLLLLLRLQRRPFERATPFRMRTLALGPVGTEPREVKLAQLPPHMLLGAVRTQRTKAHVVVRTRRQLGRRVDVQVQTLLPVGAVAVAHEEVALGHLAQVILVEEFAVLALLAQPAQPVLADEGVEPARGLARLGGILDVALDAARAVGAGACLVGLADGAVGGEADLVGLAEEGREAEVVRLGRVVEDGGSGGGGGGGDCAGCHDWGRVWVVRLGRRKKRATRLKKGDSFRREVWNSPRRGSNQGVEPSPRRSGGSLRGVDVNVGRCQRVCLCRWRRGSRHQGMGGFDGNTKLEACELLLDVRVAQLRQPGRGAAREKPDPDLSAMSEPCGRQDSL